MLIPGSTECLTREGPEWWYWNQSNKKIINHQKCVVRYDRLKFEGGWEGTLFGVGEGHLIWYMQIKEHCKHMKIEIDNWNWFGISIYILTMFTGRALNEDKSLSIPEGAGDSHIKVRVMLVRKFKWNPKGRPRWVWLKLKLTLREIFVWSVSGHFLKTSSCTIRNNTWMGKYNDFPS